CQSKTKQNATTRSPAAIAPQKCCHELTPIFTDAEKALCESVFHLCSSVARQFLEDDRISFGHDENFVFNAVDTRGRAQALERFLERLVAETKRSVMHRHERFRVELVERADRFLRIHVHFARERRIVSAD